MYNKTCVVRRSSEMERVGEANFHHRLSPIPKANLYTFRKGVPSLLGVPLS